MLKFGKSILSAVALDALTKSSFFALMSVTTVFLLDSGLENNFAPIVASGIRSMFLFAAIFAPFVLARVEFRRLITSLLLLIIALLLAIIYCGGRPYMVIFALLFIVIFMGFLRPITPALAIAQVPHVRALRSGANILLYVAYNLGAFCGEFGSSFLYKHGGISRVGSMAICLNIFALGLAFYWLPKYRPVSLDFGVVKNAMRSVLSWFSRKVVVAPESRVLRAVLPVVLVDLMFYFAYDQIYSTMIVHTRRMKLEAFGYTFVPSQMQLINSFLVISCAGLISRFVRNISPWTRHRVGILAVALAYLTVSFYEFLLGRADGGLVCLWDLIPYGIMTVGEILVFVAESEIMMVYVGEKSAVVGMSMIAIAVAFANLLGSLALSIVTVVNAWYFVFLAGVLLCAFLTSCALLKNDSIGKG